MPCRRAGFASAWDRVIQNSTVGVNRIDCSRSVAHQAQRLGTVRSCWRREIEVQAHQLLELEQYFAGLVLADFRGAVDVPLRAEVFLADHAQVERPVNRRCVAAGRFLGFLDLLQGVDQHLVVVAVPRASWMSGMRWPR